MHAVSLCVIGVVIEFVWLSEMEEGGGGMVIYVDIGPAVLILDLTAEVEGRPDEKRRRLITVSTDPGMLT